MMDSILLAVRSGKYGLHSTVAERVAQFVEMIERTPRQHSGWQSITYKGKRYQLMGGIRTDYWINLSLPIKGKQ